MPSATYCVIGSGLAGISCAKALLDEGAEVLMIDAGLECENDKMAVVQRMAAKEPEQWDRNDIISIRGSYLESRAKHAFKPVYGSDFPYAKSELAVIAQNGTKCLVSHARGGFSNVWGAALLPSCADDLKGWPLNLDALVPSYAAVAKILGVAGHEDSLTEMFPFYAEPHSPVKSSRQARFVLRRWLQNRSSLSSAGITFGRARLAVRTRNDGTRHYCRLTGLCLSGCPYSSIYNSQQTLEELRKNPRFRYESGWIAEKIQEEGAAVRIRCRSAEQTQGAATEFVGRRVFIACGALGTAKLLLASLNDPPKRLNLRYQPYFLLPLLAFFRCPRVDREKLSTLAQAFVEIKDPGISEHLIHLQFYTYNDFIKEKISAALKFVPSAFSGGIGSQLWDRMLVIQGYLHSQDGNDIALTTKQFGGETAIALSGRLPLSTKWKMLRIVAKLARKSKELGGFPLLPLMELGTPGEGNHIGSIFPMSKNPAGCQSDLWGRVGGQRRTHAVDATVLPSLPATTISYTAMANAHRIARDVARQDAKSSRD